MEIDIKSSQKMSFSNGGMPYFQIAYTTHIKQKNKRTKYLFKKHLLNFETTKNPTLHPHFAKTKKKKKNPHYIHGEHKLLLSEGTSLFYCLRGRLLTILIFRNEMRSG